MLDIVKFASDFFKLPHPALQKRWVGEYEDVTTHTLGKTPKKLIGERRPYEDEVIKKYRLDNFQSMTRGPFSRFMTNLQRVFSAAQVTIETGNETVQEFITGPNFLGMDLRSFWARRVAMRTVNDPNGFLVRWVSTPPEAANVRAQPTVMLVLSKNVRHYSDDVLTWYSGEKSPVLVPDPAGPDAAGGQLLVEANEGEVYYVVTKTDYWKYIQFGKKEERNFEMRHHYAHNLNRFPFDVIGGEETSEPNPETNEDDVWMQSFVASALPSANECVRQWSDHQGVLVVSGFPLREMEPVNCSYEGCEEGKIRRRVAGTDDAEIVTCPSCKGRGKIAPFTPYGVLLRNKASALAGGAGKVDDRDMVKYLNPDPAILEFGGKTWREYRADLEKELTLLFIEESQSGVAKEIDREDKVAKLDVFGNHLFEVLMRRTLIDFGDLMFAPLKPETLNITQPPTYTVRTEEELSLEIEGARKGEQPGSTVTQLVLEYNRKRFAGNRAQIKRTEILADYDALFGWTQAAVTQAQAGGVVDSLMARRHMLADTALRRMVRLKGEQVLDQKDIFDQLDAAIEELMPETRITDELDQDAERQRPPEKPGGKPPGKDE